MIPFTQICTAHGSTIQSTARQRRLLAHRDIILVVLVTAACYPMYLERAIVEGRIGTSARRPLSLDRRLDVLCTIAFIGLLFFRDCKTSMNLRFTTQSPPGANLLTGSNSSLPCPERQTPHRSVQRIPRVCQHLNDDEDLRGPS